MIRVVNKRNHKPGDAAQFYIGRPSPLGNPFAIHQDGDRETVIDLYRAWLADRFNDNNYELMQIINQIAEAAREGDVDLICWCAPLACHGDIIREAIIATFSNEEDKW